MTCQPSLLRTTFKLILIIASVASGYESKAQAPIWSHAYGTTQYEEDFYKMDIDAQENLYIGAKYVTTNNSSILVLKYNSAGTKLWDHTFANTFTGGFDEFAYSSPDYQGTGGIIAVSTEVKQYRDIHYLHYDGTSITREVRFGDTLSYNSSVVKATGNSSGTKILGKIGDTTSVIYMTMTGNGEWRRDIPDVGTPYQIFGDRNDNSYISYVPAISFDSLKISRLDRTGSIVSTFSTSIIESDPGTHLLAADDAKSIYLGYRFDSLAKTHARIYKYDSSGVKLWSCTLVCDSHSLTSINDMAIDRNGNLFVLADYDWLGGSEATVFSCINANNGTVLWEKKQSANYINSGVIRLDSVGNVYMSTTSTPPGSFGFDLMSDIKYSPSGTLLWNNFISVTGYEFYTTDMAVAPTGNLYVGATTSRLGNLDLYVAKLGAGPSGIIDDDNLQSLKIYPNPTIDRATLHIASLSAGTYTAGLFDINGRLAKQVFSDMSIQGGELNYSFSTAGLAYGVYYLHLKDSTGIVATQKLVVE